MQTENRLFDDLARMANGAINTLSGVREEIESRLRERVERWLAEMDMVPREEFEAIKELAQKARAEQEDLTAKVAALEQKLSAMSAGAVGPEAEKGGRQAGSQGRNRAQVRARDPSSHDEGEAGRLSISASHAAGGSTPPAALRLNHPFGSLRARAAAAALLARGPEAGRSGLRRRRSKTARPGRRDRL
jgi:hypothetical protein